ncbi:heparinase [Rhodobacterales bacterium FZCC0069]|nr:heparinase [Rhodobacterales bacterium FZCC0069]
MFNRYFHTLRYLKFRQIYYRIWYRFSKPRSDDACAPGTRGRLGTFHTPARRRVSLLAADKFIFLNEIGSLSDLGWESSGKPDPVSKLWRYNQHYFDDLNAVDAHQRSEWHLALLQRWVTENELGASVGWDPYPTSLRIVNWIKWHYAGNALPHDCVQSLAEQARWLMKRIEWHILGNHLFSNAKALIFAGVFFSGEEATLWLNEGLNIVCNQLPEQVLSDGGHFERSPMYHAIFLEDLLDLLNLSQAFPGVIPQSYVAQWRAAAEKLLYWQDGMTHPDADIAFFNDAAIGIAPTPAELSVYARKLGLKSDPLNARVCHFSQSGYVRLAARDAIALIDVAPVGPDYLPGHAHADTLSFELSLFGQRVFVNGGTSEYGTSAVRHYERGTAAHNTVLVNGENSSEVWAGFRVARRAYPQDLSILRQKDTVTVACSHNGYCRLPGKPVHRRTWRFSGSSLVVSDHVDGSFRCAVAYFHVHPAMIISSIAANDWLLHTPQGHTVLVSVELGVPEWSTSYYAPEFGIRLKRHCLKVGLGEIGARVRIDWGSFV